MNLRARPCILLVTLPFVQNRMVMVRVDPMAFDEIPLSSCPGCRRETDTVEFYIAKNVRIRRCHDCMNIMEVMRTKGTYN